MAHGKTDRTPAKEISIHGIPYRYNDPPFVVRGYYRSRISVQNPKSKKKEKLLGVVEAKSINVLNEKIEETISRFPLENKETIIRWKRTERFFSLQQ